MTMGPTRMPAGEVTILERLIEMQSAALTPQAARYFLSLNLPVADRQRMEELSERASYHALTPTEQAELETYVRVNDLLLHWQAKARQAIAAPRPCSAGAGPRDESEAIAPGIRRSMETYWRDLPRALAENKRRDQWICFHLDERVGIGTYEGLLQQCRRRGIPDDEYYLARIRRRSRPPWEPEDVEAIGSHNLDRRS